MVSVVLSDPLDWGLQEPVQRAIRGMPTAQLLISEPESIRLFLTRQELRVQEEDGRKHVSVGGREEDPSTQPDREVTGRVMEMRTNGILRQDILVVEDDRDQRLLVERHLTNAGYRVSAAEDGVDALMKLGQQPYDLVLSDINMPNLEGLKLLELLSLREVGLPVVFLSAESGDTAELRGFELGAVDYLHKPISKDVLHLRIARALGRPPGWTPGADPSPFAPMEP